MPFRRCSARVALAACALFSLTTGAARAELPPPYRTLLDSALASGNDSDIDTIAKYLKKANPDDVAEIDRIVRDRREQIAEARHDRLQQLTLIEGWKGEGQFGASQSSGNSTTVGLTAGLNMTREALHWRFGVHGLVDYQRTNGATSRNQMRFSFEPDYRFDDRLFAFGLAQYERDRFAGFTSRTALSGGIGYRVIAQSSLTVDVKAGPAWRKTNYIAQPHESEITGLGAVAAKLKVSPAISLTEDASALTGTNNTNFSSLTSLSAKINGSLSARTSYQVTYNSNPPDTFRNVDTITRFTLVYGF